jgi:hypothetical protein
MQDKAYTALNFAHRVGHFLVNDRCPAIEIKGRAAGWAPPPFEASMHLKRANGALPF